VSSVDALGRGAGVPCHLRSSRGAIALLACDRRVEFGVSRATTVRAVRGWSRLWFIANGRGRKRAESRDAGDDRWRPPVVLVDGAYSSAVTAGSYAGSQAERGEGCVA